MKLTKIFALVALATLVVSSAPASAEILTGPAFRAVEGTNLNGAVVPMFHVVAADMPLGAEFCLDGQKDYGKKKKGKLTGVSKLFERLEAASAMAEERFSTRVRRNAFSECFKIRHELLAGNIVQTELRLKGFRPAVVPQDGLLKGDIIARPLLIVIDFVDDNQTSKGTVVGGRYNCPIDQCDVLAFFRDSEGNPIGSSAAGFVAGAGSKNFSISIDPPADHSESGVGVLLRSSSGGTLLDEDRI